VRKVVSPVLSIVALAAFGSAPSDGHAQPAHAACNEFSRGLRFYVEHRGAPLSHPTMTRTINSTEHAFDPEPVLRAQDIVEMASENSFSQRVVVRPSAVRRLARLQVRDRLLLRVDDRDEAMARVVSIDAASRTLRVNGIFFGLFNGVSACDRFRGRTPSMR
jgi:hypothetical protein